MRYEFRVDGIMSDEARAAFADMRITELPRQTLIDGEVLDESHLRGVIAQLRTLGLNLISALPDPDRGRGISASAFCSSLVATSEALTRTALPGQQSRCHGQDRTSTGERRPFSRLSLWTAREATRSIPHPRWASTRISTSLAAGS